MVEIKISNPSKCMLLNCCPRNLTTCPLAEILKSDKCRLYVHLPYLFQCYQSVVAVFRTFPLYKVHMFSILAGVCWMSADPRTSVCREAFNLNMTREKCCNISNVPSVSWTPEDHISRSRLFYVNFLSRDAIRCQRCHSE